MELIKKMQIICLSLVAIISILVIAILILLSPTCELVEHSEFNGTNLNTVASKNLKALVRVGGNIQFSKNVLDKNHLKTYLNFEINSVSYTNESNHESLTLEHNCFKINMIIQRDTQRIKAPTMELEYSGIIGIESSKCTANSYTIETMLGTHYKCTEPRYYYCSADGKKLVAWITFETLEFELGGNPESVALKKFSTESQSCA